MNSYRFRSVYNPVIVFKLNDNEYRMNFHHAALISTKVLEKSLLDTSISQIQFNCFILTNRSYKLFEKYISGEVINEEISPNMCSDLYRIGATIGNEFLMRPYLSTIENLQISIETLPKFFEYSRITGIYDKLLDFVSKNFYNIDKNLLVQEISKIGFDFAERLIISDNLTISSEEELAEFIVSLAKQLRESINLLKYVKTAFLPHQTIENILKECRELGFNESDSPVLLTFLSEFFENSNKNLQRKSDTEIPQQTTFVERKDYEEKVKEVETLTEKMAKMDSDFQELVADLQNNTESELSRQKIMFDRRMSGITALLNDPIFQQSQRNSIKLRVLQKSSGDFNSIYNCFDNFCKKNDTKAILFGVLTNYHEVRSVEGNNIILEAASRNNYNLAVALVTCSADPVCQNLAGDTILHYFCRNENVEAVRYFATIMDVNHFNVKKESPLTIAMAKDNTEIIGILAQRNHHPK